MDEERENTVMPGAPAPEPELVRNRKWLIAENCFNGGQMNLVNGNFLTGLFLLLNANSLQIGLISILTYVCSIGQILSPLVMERLKSRKRLLIWSRIVITSLNIVLVGLCANLPAGEDLRITLILCVIAVYNMIHSFTNPAVSAWHIQSVPDYARADYFAKCTRFERCAMYAVTLAGGLILDAFKARDLPMAGFMVLRGIAVLCAAADVYVLTQIPEYPYGQSEPVSLKTLFMEPLHNRRYMTDVIIGFMWFFVSQTSGAYFTVYLLEDMKVSYTFLNVTGAAYVLVNLAVAGLWARYIRKKSWYTAFWTCLLCYGVIYCFHPFTVPGYLWVYPAVAIGCDVFAVAMNLITCNLSYLHIPESHQTVYLSFYATVSMIGAILGSVFATGFMSATEGRTFRFFGLDATNGQFLPFICGLLLIAVAAVVFIIDRRDKKAAKA